MKKTTNSNPLKYFNDAAAARAKSVIAGNNKLMKAQAGAEVDYKKEYKFKEDSTKLADAAENIKKYAPFSNIPSEERNKWFDAKGDAEQVDFVRKGDKEFWNRMNPKKK